MKWSDVIRNYELYLYRYERDGDIYFSDHQFSGQVMPRNKFKALLIDINIVQHFYNQHTDEDIERINAHIAEWDEHRPVEQETKYPETKTSVNKAGYVYILEFDGYYKIGLSRNLERRIWLEISPQLPKLPVLIGYIETPNMLETEKGLHAHFSDKRLNGEWFQLDHLDYVYLASQVGYQRCSHE